MIEGSMEMKSEADYYREEADYFRRLATQRGARMQIMREMFREVDWHHACMERPEMREWFDKDGVPTHSLPRSE